MADSASGTGWWNEIRRRVRDRDIERQILYSRVRQAGVRPYLERYLPGGLPALVPEFLKTLLGTVIAFWIIASLLSYFVHARPLYTLAAFGLFYSLQATYYKYRLAVNPDYQIPKCKCAGAAKDGTETVLKSGASAILGIPTSALGVVLYAALLLLVSAGLAGPAMLMAVLAMVASAYLAYVMVARIGGLCSTCINIAALNVLILWQFVR